MEEAAERFVSQFLELSDGCDIKRAVLLHTQLPDKTQQLLIRAYFALQLFPPGITQHDYNETLHHTKLDLRRAAESICDPANVNDVVSVFINAFHKRSPKCLAEEAGDDTGTSYRDGAFTPLFNARYRERLAWSLRDPLARSLAPKAPAAKVPWPLWLKSFSVHLVRHV